MVRSQERDGGGAGCERGRLRKRPLHHRYAAVPLPRFAREESKKVGWPTFLPRQGGVESADVHPLPRFVLLRSTQANTVSAGFMG